MFLFGIMCANELFTARPRKQMCIKNPQFASMLSFLIDCHAPCDHIHIYITYSFCDIQSHSKQLTTVKHEKH